MAVKNQTSRISFWLSIEVQGLHVLEKCSDGCFLYVKISGKVSVVGMASLLVPSWKVQKDCMKPFAHTFECTVYIPIYLILRDSKRFNNLLSKSVNVRRKLPPQQNNWSRLTVEENSLWVALINWLLLKVLTNSMSILRENSKEKAGYMRERLIYRLWLNSYLYSSHKRQVLNSSDFSKP